MDFKALAKGSQLFRKSSQKNMPSTIKLQLVHLIFKKACSTTDVLSIYETFMEKRKGGMWNHLQAAITNNAISHLKALKTTRLSKPPNIFKVPSEAKQK